MIHNLVSKEQFWNLTFLQTNQFQPSSNNQSQTVSRIVCKFFQFPERVKEIFRFLELDSQILLVSRTCSDFFPVFQNVFQNFSGFWNCSSFPKCVPEFFQFPKWNNSGTCSGNGNQNSGFRINISGSFRFLETLIRSIPIPIAQQMRKRFLSFLK